MTKAELIEEVSRVVEMTRKDSEVIVEAIFDSVVNSLEARSRFAASAASAPASGSRVWAGIRRPERESKCLPNAFPISSPARN